MYFGFLTLVTALAISSVAIYYSVAGLAAIFAAAVIPIVIMGGVLELSKLVTAVWLHRFWHQATWWLKTYLTSAVIVLMLITSLGIFGFLSNAHVQQTAQGENTTAKISRLESEIGRQESVINRAQERIQSVQTQGVGGDSTIQSQIDREQERIDKAYTRAEPAIKEQRKIIEQEEDQVQREINNAESELEELDTAVSNSNIAKAQRIVGVEADGIYGPNTEQAIEEYRNSKSQEIDSLETRLSNLENNSRVESAREEIQRIRERVESQVAESNDLIDRLRSQLGTNTGNEVDAVVEEQNSRIQEAYQRIDSLTDEKYKLESQYRELEAEVGPIKYIAEFVYDEEANKNLLEEAVRWTIVIIIFVFDPLAVLLLIASQYTFRWHGKELFPGEGPSDNPPLPPNDPQPPLDPQPETKLPEAANEDYGLSLEEAAASYVETDSHDFYNNDRLASEYNSEALVEAETEKKGTETSVDSEAERLSVLREQDQNPSWHAAKKAWKDDHPDLTLKSQKEKYVRGEIDRLPWEDYFINESSEDQKKRSYIMKKNNEQIRKNVD